MFGKKQTYHGLISVVMPSYNHERYIGAAVDSVLGQTYSNLELIIVDDGSTDNSAEILERITDPRVRVFAQKNQGAHAAINRGLGLATGEYVAILNSDDTFCPDRFGRAIDVMHKYSNVGLVSTWIEIINSEGRHLGIKEGWRNCEPWPIRNPGKSFKACSDFKLNLLMTNFVSSTSNIVMRRSVVEKVGGMRNLRFAHDWDFLLRAAEHFDCHQIEKPLLRYRVHETNTISTNRKWMLFEICWVLAANLDRFLGKIILTDAESKMARRDVGLLFESVEFQGNDKVFWMIKAFIDGFKVRGVARPEEILLEDKALREKFIEYVAE